MTDLSSLSTNDLLVMLGKAPSAASAAPPAAKPMDLSHLSDEELLTLAQGHGLGASPAPAARAAPADRMAFDAMGNATGVDQSDLPAPKMGYGEQMANVGHIVDDTARTLARGLPFMDRISAAGTTAFGGLSGNELDAKARSAGLRPDTPEYERFVLDAVKNYSPAQKYGENLAAERSADTAIDTDHPVLSTVGTLAGGALVPMGAIGAASKATGLLRKAAAGAGAGALLGGAQGVSDSKDLTDLKDVAGNAAFGTAVGAGIGGSIPVAGRALGAGYRAIADLLARNPSPIGKGASTKLTEAMAADMPQAVRDRLSTLGPDAMLLDAGPSLQGLGQGVAVRPGEGRTIVSNTLRDRNAGANARLQDDVNAALGPVGDDPKTATAAILSHRSAIDNVNYPAALDNAPPVDTSALLANLGPAIGKSEGMEKKALVSLRDMLMTEKQVPVMNPDGTPLMAPSRSVRNAPQYRQNLGPAPQNLHDFIRAGGGIIDDGGDLKAMGLNHLIAKPGQGMSWDAAREAAAQGGYLGADIDHAMANTYTHQLSDALAEHPTYSVFDERAIADRAAAKEAAANKAGQPRASGWADGPMEPVLETKLVPKDAAHNLHKIKQEMDSVIEYDQPGLGVPAGALTRQQAALKDFRFQLNDALEKQVPGYAEANAASSPLAKRAEAVKAGTALLSDGKTAPAPARLAAEYGAMEPGEQIAFNKGARGDIDRLIGQHGNNLVELKRIVKGDGSWNRDNLATVFGVGPTDQVLNSVDRETTFRDAISKILENSQSAQRLGAAQSLDQKPLLELFKHDTAWGDTKAAIRQLLRGAVSPNHDGRNAEIAKALTATGDNRDQLVNALVDFLQRRQGRAASTGRSGDQSAALLATLANSYGRGVSTPAR